MSPYPIAFFSVVIKKKIINDDERLILTADQILKYKKRTPFSDVITAATKKEIKLPYITI